MIDMPDYTSEVISRFTSERPLTYEELLEYRCCMDPVVFLQLARCYQSDGTFDHEIYKYSTRPWPPGTSGIILLLSPGVLPNAPAKSTTLSFQHRLDSIQERYESCPCSRHLQLLCKPCIGPLMKRLHEDIENCIYSYYGIEKPIGFWDRCRRTLNFMSN